MAEQDPETWMWERARAILEQADRVQRRVPSRPGTRRPSWEPAIDIFETATEVWVLVALAGVPLERMRVELSEREVVVAGERPLPASFRNAAVHRLEIPHGTFERRLELPPGRYELDQRRVVDGCLFLSFTKLD